MMFSFEVGIATVLQSLLIFLLQFQELEKVKEMYFIHNWRILDSLLITNKSVLYLKTSIDF